MLEERGASYMVTSACKRGMLCIAMRFVYKECVACVFASGDLEYGVALIEIEETGHDWSSGIPLALGQRDTTRTAYEC